MDNLVPNNNLENLKKTFDDYKHIGDNGIEYWNSRELSSVMGYSRYQSFEPAINRAIESMKSSGIDPDDHLHRSMQMVSLGSGAVREVENYEMDRYGAYMVTMNADTKKEEVGFAQAYFVDSTNKLEAIKQRIDDTKYIEARDNLSSANKELISTLLTHEVPDNKLGTIMDAGDMGMFNMHTKEVKEMVGLPNSRPLADKLGLELATYKTAAQFLTKRRIENRDLNGVEETSSAAYDINNLVRNVIEAESGKSPEELVLDAEDIKKVRKRKEKQDKEFEKKLKESSEFRAFVESNI